MEYGEDYVEVNKFLSESIFHFFKGGCLCTRAPPPPPPRPPPLKPEIENLVERLLQNLFLFWTELP